METTNTPFTIDEILLFQFRITDRAKIYSHARRCGIDIKIHKQDNYLMGIYVPEKKLLNADVFLNEKGIKNYLDFMQKLKDNGIVHWRTVYEKRYVNAFGLD